MPKHLKMGWEKWLHSMGVAVIAGTSQSVVAWLGMVGAGAVGVDVPKLNFKALGILIASACLFNLFTYLQKSPLPEAVEEEGKPIP